MTTNGTETIYVFTQTFSSDKLNKIKREIVFINTKQSFYHLELDTSNFFPLKEDESLDEFDLQERLMEFKHSINSDFNYRNIVLIANRLPSNYFYMFSDWFSIITTYQFENLFSEDYFEKYLKNSIVSSLIHFTTDLKLSKTQHQNLTGCIFDYTRNKKEKMFVLENAHICPNHEEQINDIIDDSKKLNQYVDSLKQILE